MNRAQLLWRSRGGFGSVFVALVILGGLVGLVRADRASAATLTVGCDTTSFTTIQAAVNVAAAGDTIQVCNGTYTEQVAITTNNLTLTSQTPYSGTTTGAIIKAPANLPADSHSAIVEVRGATGVTISGFTISGPSGASGCGCFGYGVWINGGGSATVTNNHVTSIRNDPMSGDQTGWGIRAESSTLTATGNTVDDYQKNGIDVRGQGAVGIISSNKIVGAGPTPVIAQNGIVIAFGASATVSGNTVSDNDYQGDAVATGIFVFGPVGAVTISKNDFKRNGANIDVFNPPTSQKVTVSGNTTENGQYGVLVEGAPATNSTPEVLSTDVEIGKNVVNSAGTAGLNATSLTEGNTFHDNIAKGTAAPGHDCLDESTGSATAGTNNTWTKNIGDTRSPEGICSEAPIVVTPPPVIVLPPEPGTAPPVPAGPPGQEVGNEVIAKMRQKQLRSCAIEVRVLGPSRALIARGVAHAPSEGTGRLIVRINVKPKGKTLLSKNFGGVVGNVHALCRSTSGTLHRYSKRMRIVLLIEHRLTPPGAWVPDQPILTGIGLNFMSFLRHRIFATRSIQCDGYTATYPPSPAYPPTLSLHRARRVCSELKRLGGAAKARVKLVPHGLTDPIAPNNNEAGRRVNRRVFVTIVHVFVFRS